MRDPPELVSIKFLIVCRASKALNIVEAIVQRLDDDLEIDTYTYATTELVDS